MKVIFKGSSAMTSKGMYFTPGAEYDVTEEVYSYLKKTFDNVEAIEVPKSKAEPVVAPKVVASKGGK